MPDTLIQPAAEQALGVRGLSHCYPSAKRSQKQPGRAGVREKALDSVSFTVNPGEIFGILGPNGGGKSTLFKVLSTMLRPTPGSHPGSSDDASPGTAHVFGHDVLKEPALARAQLGVVFQSPSLDGKLTARENLKHHGKLYGLSGRDLKERIQHWLTFFGLYERRNEYVERFSGGLRRRVEVAKALLHEPKLLLMDEPATGLDPAARRDLWQKLIQLRDEKGMTIVMTTHLMDEAERCDRLAIMAEGRLVTVDTPANLQSRIGGDVITLEPESPESANNGDGIELLATEIAEQYGPWDAGAAPTVVDGRIRFEKPDGARVVAEIAAAFPGRIRSLTVGRPTIEDVFLHLTGASLGQDQH